jgi:hypothetical protein
VHNGMCIRPSVVVTKMWFLTSLNLETHVHRKRNSIGHCQALRSNTHECMAGDDWQI